MARIGTTRYRLLHGLSSQHMTLSTDGKLLADLGVDGEVSLIELPAWKTRRIRVTEVDPMDPTQLMGMTLSADNKTLAVCDIARMQAYLIDTNSGKRLKTVKLAQKLAQGGVRDVQLTLSRDGKTLICCYLQEAPALNQQVIVWDLEKDKVRHSFPIDSDRFNGNRLAIAISADGGWLAQCVRTGDPNRAGRQIDSRVQVWNLTTGKSQAVSDIDATMYRLALSSDGKSLAASDGSVLRIFDAATLKELHNIRGKAGLAHLAFSGKELFTGDYEGRVSRWDPVKGERTGSWHPPITASVMQFVFDPSGKILAFGNAFDAIHLWDVQSRTVHSPRGLPEAGIHQVGFSPAGDLFVASDDGMVAWWNPRTGAKLRSIELEENGADRRNGRERILDIGLERMLSPRERRAGQLVTLSRNGDFVISSDGAHAAIHDARTGKFLYDDVINQSDGFLSEPQFLGAGGKCLRMQNKKVRIWNTRTGRDVASFKIPLRENEAMARIHASPSAERVAIETVMINGDGMGRVFLWDVAGQKVIREWSQQGVDAMAFSPDEQWFVLSRPQQPVQLTRLHPGRADFELGVRNEMDEVMQAVFSPDGRQIACAVNSLGDVMDDSGRIVIHELFSKKIRLQLPGHGTGFIDSLSWSHDGALLGSGSSDTTSLVWKVGLRAHADTPLKEDAKAADLEFWYTQLSGVNAEQAFEGMIQLTRARQQAVKLLESKIAPAKKLDAGKKSIPQWIADLGSSNFAVRTKATQVLEKLGAVAEHELRQALPKIDEIETRRRVEDLLERAGRREWNAAEIGQARAVEVLEAIGTPEAIAVLTRWSGGDAGAILTIEAKKALAVSK